MTAPLVLTQLQTVASVLVANADYRPCPGKRVDAPGPHAALGAWHGA